MSEEHRITIWERFYEPSSDGYQMAHYRHNHIVDDWDLSDKPRSSDPSVDKDWSKWQWRKTFGYLINSKVVRIALQEDL